MKRKANLLTPFNSDFFKPQTESADIFFLRWIFHNWSNKYSVNIIRNLIPVMKPGTKIVVNDFMLPEPNTLPPPLEKAIRYVIRFHVIFESRLTLWTVTST